MRLAAQREFCARAEIECPVEVLVVHHVIKGKSRVKAGRGQHLEKSAVTGVVGISVATTVRVAHAQPGLQNVQRRLPAEFADKRASALSQQAPRSRLDRTPCKEVKLA